MDSEVGGTMEVAALGRPFSCGMLYDCRKDSLIPGMTLWDHDDLKKDIREEPQNYTDFEIVASESIEDKTSALNVEASLKASFLGGLVQVDGSAKYLNDSKTSKHQARVTLKYKTTTKVQELSMNHLGNMKHQNVFDKGLATHVVTAVLYGAQAFFVFDREVTGQETHRDIEGNMKGMIKKIPKIEIGGEGSLKMEDKERANVEEFSCKFYGDFHLQKTPTSFQDAIQVYQSLPQLLGAKGENAVPMKVWLLPLTSLDSSAAKLVRQISLRLIQDSESVLEDFSELEMRCNDAMRTTTAQQFPQICKKLKTFKKMCSHFKLEFQQNLAKKLPSIRGGGEEESVLAEILKKRHSSPFNSKDLNEWMDCKEREISIIKSFTNMMKNTKIVPSQTELYKETVSAEYTVCFVFTSLGSEEPYLSALAKYLQETSKPENQDPPSDGEKEEWYASKEVAEAMRRKAKLFSDFAEANKENKNIKFLTVGSTNETQKGSSICVYKDGFSVKDNFEPPSKPQTVTVSDKNHNSVTLKISPPRFGAENITSYSVEFCVCGEDVWQQKTASNAEEVTITVSDLRPNTEFKFRCRAVTSVGVGPANEVNIQTAEDYETQSGQQTSFYLCNPTMASRSAEHDTSSTYRNDEVIRIVLVGKTGAGKSATGNTILGRKKFKSKFSPESLTKHCEKAEGEVDGQKVAVIDTPGLFDTNVDEETTRKEIVQCIAFASPGPHIFLIIIKLGRYTEEEKKTVQEIQNIFGEGADKYSMVLFTGGDQLEQPIEEFLEESEDLQELVDKCNNQYHVFNNKVNDGSQVSELLRKIKDITEKNGGSHYTNDMFQEAERAIEEEKERILKEKEEEMRKEREKIQKEIEERFEAEMSKVKDDMKKQSELFEAREKEIEVKMKKIKREQGERARREAEMNPWGLVFGIALTIITILVRRLR